MSSENLSFSNALHLTTPGQANPAKARAVEMQALNKPEGNKAEQNKDEDGRKAWPSNAAEARLEANKGLLQAMFGKAGARDSNAMRIFYQEVVSKLEEVLKKELGDEEFSLQKLAEKTSGVEGQEDYWSPEQTANRIVAGATGYFEAFKKQNPNLSDEEQVEKFLSIISPAVDKGIGEAITILDGFGVFDGAIKDNALKTQEFVHEKLEAFRQRMLGLDQQQEKPLFDDSNVEQDQA
ncbi:DUF5610 domain-containing protein [Marinospirillum alkaliphilum]|uniref:DUF5610 domain-containing protein n=1 Tax=Marinospirillum alkaliphilum DSM 21637 TaxID=1122209 RepID=A0A1K1TUP2_9GAMM|nr:DUF5610 domain-containing protein [Marinospirillum alkaliphilum]SFX04270.1 hypothetical protein SAMN02745752_00319 [Marinospirillum alkaliphilum DSM 21637]